MRSHEERVVEAKRRIAKIEREKRRRRNTIIMASAVAACLALLIGASLGQHLSRRRCLGIHCHRAFGVFTRRVRDRFVLPAAADEPGGRSEQRK